MIYGRAEMTRGGWSSRAAVSGWMSLAGNRTASRREDELRSSKGEYVWQWIQSWISK